MDNLDGLIYLLNKTGLTLAAAEQEIQRLTAKVAELEAAAKPDKQH